MMKKLVHNGHGMDSHVTSIKWNESVSSLCHGRPSTHSWKTSLSVPLVDPNGWGRFPAGRRFAFAIIAAAAGSLLHPHTFNRVHYQQKSRLPRQ